jgi:O-antigen/teichoic acid export membrane protein
VIARFRSNDVVRHGAAVFGGVAFASLFNYLFYMLLGRRVGVEPYGVVTSLASALLVVGAPAIVTQLIAARLASDLEAQHNIGGLRRLADLVTLYAGIVFFTAAVIGYVFRGAIAGYFNLTETGPLVVALIALAVFGITTAQRGVLQGAHCFGDLAASMAIDAGVKVVVGVGLAGMFGATGALVGIATGSAVALGYNQFAFRARFGTSRNPVALEPGLIGRVVAHVGIGQLTLTVLMFYDVPLVKHVFDARSAGLYAAAALVGRAVISAVSFVPTVVMPKATARAAAGRSALPLLGMALGISCAIVVVAALLGVVAPRAVVTLIAGKAFAEAAPLVLSYIGASGLLSLANVVAAYKMGLHRYDFVVPALVVALGEITVISMWHPSLLAVVYVLLAGHAAVLAVTLFRVAARSGVRPADAVQEIAASTI